MHKTENNDQQFIILMFKVLHIRVYPRDSYFTEMKYKKPREKFSARDVCGRFM